MDFGRSDDPRVQAQLDRLSALSVPQGRFGLETITALMERLGNPHRKLPPVFHVAGTNGKGSVCAFLRAMLAADGKCVHVTTSPHLVRYNERIRIAGKLIGDGPLAELLEEVLDAGEGLGPSFFEVTIAAAFLAFSRTPADACVVEVGLGGRFDATNVLEPETLAACGIAALGLDHERFLLAPEDGVPEEPMARIAFEKAGIAKKGVPLIASMPDYLAEAQRAIRKVAAEKSTRLIELTIKQMLEFGPQDCGLRGEHQSRNAALAAALLRCQSKLCVSEDAMRRGLAQITWPARLQRLRAGPLVGTREVWLDGGHNPSAGNAIAAEFEGLRPHLIIGMLAGKDPQALLGPMQGLAQSLQVVPIPHHDSHEPSAFGPDAVARRNLEHALLNVPVDGHPILIAGSLYLAGEALRLNDEVPV